VLRPFLSLEEAGNPESAKDSVRHPALRSGKRKHPEMKIIARDLTDRMIAQPVVYYSTPVTR
jgi:hypothetical protein